jgi:transposase
MWCGVSAIKQKESDMNATAALPVVGVDLAKTVIQLAVADGSWRVVESHRLTRTQFERWFVNRAVGLVVMEACGSAHHWARWLNGLGIAVRLLPAAYIRAYVKRNKTDAVDAYALLEAARCVDARQVEAMNRRVHSTAWLGRRLFERTQNCIDARLIPRPLRFQPLQHIGIEAKRD